MSSPEKRRDMDIMKLAMHDFKVEICKDDAYDIVVDFHGPQNTIYEGGLWKVKIILPTSELNIFVFFAAAFSNFAVIPSLALYVKEVKYVFSGFL